jgi:AcrR family transcriptional regulator
VKVSADGASTSSGSAREAILEAAVQEFVEHGYDGVRMEHVARRAGCNKALVYRYFGDRDLLWLRFPRHRGNTPLLVVGGQADFALTSTSQAKIAAFHGAPLQILDDAPHDAMLTHPCQVVDVLDRFAARLE